MGFLIFSLFITLCTVGVVIIGSLVKYGMSERKVQFKKTWLVLFGTPGLNIIVLIGIIIVGVYHVISEGPEWIFKKLNIIHEEEKNGK